MANLKILKRITLSGFLFAALTVPVVSCAQPAAAQSASALPSAVWPSLSYCKSSTLNGAEFMLLIKTILVHGDLADVAFTEKTFGTKFSSSFGWGTDGKLDPHSTIYKTDEVLGHPIHIKYYVANPKAKQTWRNEVASIYIESLYFPASDANFIHNCLHISRNDFLSYFGGGFSPVGISGASPLPPGSQIPRSTIASDKSGPLIVGYKQTLGSFGKNSSKLYLSFAFGERSDGWPDNLINSVTIEQDR